MAGVRGLAILVVVVWACSFFYFFWAQIEGVLACLAEAPGFACIAEARGFAVANKPDGLPRFRGYPETPTEHYGPTPPCYRKSVAVTCDWYGFSHDLYPVEGAACLTVTRREFTALPPGVLHPYTYYCLRSMFFNTTDTWFPRASYCLYGCFDMSATSPSSATAKV